MLSEGNMEGKDGSNQVCERSFGNELNSGATFCKYNLRCDVILTYVIPGNGKLN